MLERMICALEKIDAAQAVVEEAHELGHEAARKAPENQSFQETSKIDRSARHANEMYLELVG
jgi:hypothetical protein